MDSIDHPVLRRQGGPASNHQTREAPGFRNSQAGLLHWFNTLADASTTPLVIYDIPYRTGEDLQMFATVAQGGVGTIAAGAHLATARFVRVIALLHAGELQEARPLWTGLVLWLEAAKALGVRFAQNAIVWSGPDVVPAGRPSM